MTIEKARSDAQELANEHGEPFGVVVGYDDHDRLDWCVVPKSEMTMYDGDDCFIAYPQDDSEIEPCPCGGNHLRKNHPLSAPVS